MRIFIRSLILLLLAVCTASLANAQAWYVDGQRAIEIQIPKMGLYAIGASQISGFYGDPVGTLKLIHNGKEVAILLKDSDLNDVWSAGDSLFFFGDVNKGEAEKTLYQRPEYQNPDAPLYSLDGRYYLLSSSGLGLRMRTTKINNSAQEGAWLANLTLSPKTQYTVGTGAYQYNKFHQSFIGYGEGWTTPNFPYNQTIQNPYKVRPGNTSIFAKFCGRDLGKNTAYIYVNGSRYFGTTVSDFGLVTDTGRAPSSVFSGVIELKTGADNNSVSVMWAKFQIPVLSAALATPWVLQSAGSAAVSSKINLAQAGPLVLQVNDFYNPKVLAKTDSTFFVDGDTAQGAKSLVWAQKAPYVVPDSTLRGLTLKINILPAKDEVLFLTNSVLKDSVAAYAAYRSSVAGGQYNVRTLFVEDLYPEFGFGNPTPEAIRAYFLKAIGAGALPKSVFIIGKGLQHDRIISEALVSRNLVPTWGLPASDNYFTTPDTGLFYNHIPISRLAAKNGHEVMNYLRKVQQLEGQKDLLWKKNAAHLSGGRDQSEIEQFRNYLDIYTKIFQGLPISGSAYQHSKQSLSVIEAVNIRNKLNEGLSILTLFGHSASTQTDVDIGYCSDPGQGYDNAGKYPLIYINGCYAGDIYAPENNSLNEDWVLIPNKGAIAFAGSMDEGLPTLLNKQATIFYNLQFKDTASISNNLGDIFQELGKRYFIPGSGSFDSIVVSQTILHGDPLVRIFPFKRPDFAFNQSTSKITDQDIIAAKKSFSLRLDIQNLGLYNPADSISVIVKISTSTKSIVGAPILLPALRRDTVINYKISGLIELDNSSTIECVVDYLNKVKEQSEENNVLTLSIGRFESGISLISPAPDDIVGTPKLNVQYRTLSTAQYGKVFIEIDTTQTFSSGLRISYQGIPGPLQQYDVQLPDVPDSTVFYIRYRLQQNADITAWKSYAFTFISKREGWSQSTGFQYYRSLYEGFKVDSSKVHFPWSYIPNQTTVRLYTVGDSIAQTLRNTGIDINGVPFFYGTASSCIRDGNNRLHQLRLKKISLEPYVQTLAPVDFYWLYSCGREPATINFYTWDDLKQDVGNRSSFFISEMAVGDYYFAISQGRIDYPHLGLYYRAAAGFVGVHTDSVKTTPIGSPFATYGIRTKDYKPNSGWTVLPKKNNGIIDARETIDTTIIINRAPTEGKVSTLFIGPSTKFSKVAITTSRKAWNRDSAVFTVRAYSDFIDTGLVVYRGNPKSLDLSNLPTDKKYVKLFYEAPNLGDSTTFLDTWRVFYTPVPEGVAYSAETPAKVDAGDSILMVAKYLHTIGNVGDTLVTAVYVRTGSGAPILFDTLNAIRKPGTDTSYVYYKYSTSQISPDSLLFQIRFNNSQLPERNYNNNTVYAKTVIKKDSNMYYGYFEIDGTVPESYMPVSSSPKIVYYLNHDFAGKQAIVKFGPSCDTCSLAPTTAFTLVGNKVIFSPGSLSAGMYEVQTIVQDKYRLLVPKQSITFEVLSEDSLKLFKVYPNPAKDNVSFVYQCSAKFDGGSADVKVLNSFGREVYSSHAEHSDLIAGRFAWDIRSSHDNLPPGVYLAQFKVTTNNAQGEPNKVFYRSARLVVVW